MDAAEESTFRNAQYSDIDDLFDYDAGLEEVPREAPNASYAEGTKPSTRDDTSGLGLGLDEEVKVARKRKPTAKLDESRLLSQSGIPKLRRTAKSKLKLKGKGHEFSDAARLLNFYQLWLDDLFPRAKFSDGLAIIEKLGHSKRLQTMRREWIDEEKPKPHTSELEEARHGENTFGGSRAISFGERLYTHDPAVIGMDSSQLNAVDGKSWSFNSQFPSGGNPPQQDKGVGDLADPEFLLSDNERNARNSEAQHIPEHDELEVLLNEQESGGFEPNGVVLRPQEHDGFNDELEAMEEFGILDTGYEIT
ncbi:chromosome segregation in meiosis- protein [Monascus purpureus]|uniref:Chromosome segregation in meiosis protein n=1 Tax=Monascus purpureus TaxID=5098 RepID=A0A507QM44_MONPU|nr:chromosome segregation in meiosis- protein [Monascus purpureus]